jgi:signal transduction histidine kinase
VDNVESEVLISIKDSGIGMPNKIKDSLFSSTAKTSRPGTNGEKGTGFGMPLVKVMIEEMGGHVTVDSIEKVADNQTDHGTTIHLKVPKAA